MLARLLGDAGTPTIVDLCSGATGPWSTLIDALSAHGVDSVHVTFTDKHVNQKAVHELELRRDRRLMYHPSSIDALRVPATLRRGVRTMFTGFHHFRPADALSILESARRDRVPIAVFEITERSLRSPFPSDSSS